MLYQQKIKSYLFLIIILVFLFMSSACAQVNSTIFPTTTFTPPILNTITPSQTNIPITISEPEVLPTCTTTDADGKLYVLSDDVTFAWGTTEEEIDTALEDSFPEWATYRQNVEWNTSPIKMGEIIINASWQERFILNPSINIVTLGESFNWQLPPDKDLYLESLSVNERLNLLWVEWTSPDNEFIRNRHPDISNASTYALYMFFNQNTEKLVSWCNTYHKLFKTSPLFP